MLGCVVGYRIRQSKIDAERAIHVRDEMKTDPVFNLESAGKFERFGTTSDYIGADLMDSVQTRLKLGQHGPAGNAPASVKERLDVGPLGLHLCGRHQPAFMVWQNERRDRTISGRRRPSRTR